MLPHFIDREREIEFLEKIYRKEGFKLVILYGRRRIGKTELIKYFIKSKNGFYFLSTDESLAENIKGLKNVFYEITKKDYFLKIETESFYDLFRYLAVEIGNKKIVLAIDEFPYILSLNKGLLSSFQKIIDELLKNKNVVLILCGSSLSVMENDVLGYKSPLYGREVNPWKLLSFEFRIINNLIKDPKDAMETFFIFGGVPYYLKFFSEKQGLMTSIRENILTKGIGLYDEPLILLRQEFRESRTYRLILKYVSLGYKTIGKLCSATGMDKSNAMKYLSTLEEVNLLKHILPFGMKRKGYYEISDPFFRFWFRFVYPNRNLLEMGNVSTVEGDILKNMNSFFGTSFEYLIEELMNHKVFEDVSDYGKISKWWHKDKEIDIIALNEEKKEILFCECKWKDKVNAGNIVKELREKAGYVKWHNDERKESFAVFAKSFKKKIKEFEERKVYCFDLKDIEKNLK